MNVGDIFNSRSCGKFKVLKVNNSKDVEVEFLTTKFKTRARFDSIRSGSIKDKLSKAVHGVGYIGIGEFKTSINGSNNQAYKTWQRMLGRCYDPNYINSSCYDGCSVHVDWHNFQSFAKWFYDNYPEDKGSEYHLDKDCIIEGNKVYSDKACSFVTLKENVIKARAKSYTVKSPYGELSKIYNMAEFCRDNDLDKANLHRTLKKGSGTHKGWSIVSKSQ